MTALKQYQVLECPGLWRPSSKEKRMDIIVSIGATTLVMYDYNNQPRSHWSLPALIRLNGSTRPAIFAPGTASEEELEISDDSMIDAIEQVQKAVERHSPRWRRSKRTLVAVLLGALLTSCIIWLPDSLINYAAAMVPDTKRAELGERLLIHMQQTSGRPCHTAEGTAALRRLHDRLLGNRPGRLVVIPNGVSPTNHLPGGLILLHPDLIEDHEAPDVLAEHVVAEAIRAEEKDSVVRVLERAGLVAAIRLLATGDVAENVLFAQAGTLLSQPAAPVEREMLLERYREARIPTKPYTVTASDSGQNATEPIKADRSVASPALSDADWVSLQGICGS